MSNKILINGNFLCRNLTGIERFAFEICRQLDSILAKKQNSSVEYAILVPANAKSIPVFNNIKIIHGKLLKSFPRWDLFYFSKMCKKHKATGLNFSNTAPLSRKCGYAFLHDIYAKDFPEDFTSKKDKLIRLYSCINYRNIAKNAKKVLTVSNFSKNQIQKAYKVDDSRISVIPNGWDHFLNIAEDNEIFKRFPRLSEQEFFFTLGSLQKRKNLKWIAQYAKKHPEQTFAISGKVIGGMHSPEIEELSTLKNVLLLGYVSDGEVKSLMKKCLAFIFPSYYEGFGIPPLEALSVGAKIIVAKSASLPEIYGNAAIYIDPKDTDCNLQELLGKQISEEEKNLILDKFTYQNSANMLYNLLEEAES
ncbi:glycosyltransferase family 1 protein [uncultured Treponema sp.]|uniref:glycosyltransferase family 4 protein n=1 Tax=uncultured Treponema sp. TaxID=162155 RepID=UPI0025E0855F|nr:glycosyltransferase family 1 protein [uncultured Treponema sp.]